MSVKPEGKIFYASWGVTAALIPHSFLEDGTVERGVVQRINTAGKVEQDSGRKFVRIPPNWKTAWTKQNLPDTGAFLYADIADYRSFDVMSKDLSDAWHHRQKLYAELRGDVYEPPAPGVTPHYPDVPGMEPDLPKPQPAPAPKPTPPSIVGDEEIDPATGRPKGWDGWDKPRRREWKRKNNIID